LDISHLLITRQNVGDERLGNLNDYPFQLVREIHLSGATRDSGILWDNHAAHMSEEAWNLFRYVLGRCQPSAVTLEYNWAAAFPVDAILGELQQARSILGLS
jgi:uncharacterized protein (UPF0276 family)